MDVDHSRRFKQIQAKDSKACRNYSSCRTAVPAVLGPQARASGGSEIIAEALRRASTGQPRTAVPTQERLAISSGPS
jgi:hypothetical protein